MQRSNLHLCPQVICALQNILTLLERYINKFQRKISNCVYCSRHFQVHAKCIAKMLTVFTRLLNFPFSKRPNEVEYSECYFDFNIVQLGFEATLTLYIVQIA